MRVVVAEKPSVARDLARVLGASRRRQGYLEGEGLRISWCFGHMAELEEPAHYDEAWRRWSLDALPMLPDAFELRARKDARDQLDVLKRLLSDPQVEDVVNACDAGREGELIFRYVMQLLGCGKPVLRLWVSSLTDQAIQLGWRQLRPGSTLDPLADAARCRAESDWLVGLNATRALTCRTRETGPGTLLSVGRVQTPTLAMIVARDREIEAFVPEPFWQIKATFEAPAERMEGVGDEVPSRWEGTWFRGGDEGGKKKKGDDDEVSHAERVSDAATAEAIARATEGQIGRVERASRKRVRDKPPLLYDLTSLQRRANQRYGLSAQKTLDLAQALYEKHKLITYPRTDARYLTPDQVPTLADVVQGLVPIPAYAQAAQAILAHPIQPGKRVVNAKEVGDHHAILPTGRTPSSARLSPDEKRVFDLVARRLLAALSEDALFDTTVLVVAVPPEGPLPEGVEAPLRYRARGRVCRREGWRAIDPPKKRKEAELPPVEVDDPAPVVDVRTPEGQTRPPRPYTDASILHAMETAGRELDEEELQRAMRSCGLGTPATRASILQTLLRRKYIERDAKALRSTEQGRALIDAVPVEGLKSAALTGRWEGRLTEVAESGAPRPAFMADVVAYVEEVVDAIRTAPAPEVKVALPEGDGLGPCPACGKPVRPRGGGKVFACDSGRSCPFVVFGTMSRRKISARMVKQLLAEGRSGAVKGFRSKKGNDFAAGLVWEADQQRVGFWFPEREDRRPPSSSRSPSSSESRPLRVGDRCPSCGKGTIIRGRTALGCDRYREGCQHRAPLR